MKLSKILIGAMRFKDRESAVAVIRAAIDAGFNYIDTSPCYCYKSANNNSECWTGEGVNHPKYRTRVMVSTKSAPGDGGFSLGRFNPAKGFGVRTKKQFKQVLDQSLSRLGLPKVDYYHLWTTHTLEQFKEALKPDGWYDGLKACRDKWDHLGVTTHADSKVIIEFLKTGLFETVTLPLNVINTTRLEVADYCAEKNINFIAMNPLAGGFLAVNGELKELALRYLMAIPNVHPLIGFSSLEEVKYAKWIEDTMPSYKLGTKDILKRVNKIMDTSEPRCTACGYCQPCPNNINVGSALSYYNAFKYLRIREAKKSFKEKQWEDGLRLDRCTECGQCESRCPNGLPVIRIIKDARKLMY